MRRLETILAATENESAQTLIEHQPLKKVSDSESSENEKAIESVRPKVTKTQKKNSDLPPGGLTRSKKRTMDGSSSFQNAL